MRRRSLRNVLFPVLFLCSLLSSIQAGDLPLLKVKDLAPGVIVDMRYASPNNFTGHTLYSADECLLCSPAALRLAQVQKKLEKKGLGLKIWDCYRPLSVQKKLWELVPDPRYVADPKTGSKHNRGASVDLTLVDNKGRELTMPTPYDEFSERAHRNYMNLFSDAIKNREILREAMESEGFEGIPTEWWHFDDPEWKNYSLRNEPLDSRSLLTDIQTSESPSFPNVSIGNDDALQLILVISKDWDSTKARLQRYDKFNGHWKKTGPSRPVSLGLKGMAWGLGQKPQVAAGPMKKEGDNRAAAGRFKVGISYGYDKKPPTNTTWPYHQIQEGWMCVDDPASRSYNQVIDGKVASKDWKSAELMRRKDHLYKWVINIEQNPVNKAGCGSCIFLHVWRKQNSATEGCTAMEESAMVGLLKWLKPQANPVIVQLTEESYTQLKKSWDLP